LTRRLRGLEPKRPRPLANPRALALALILFSMATPLAVSAQEPGKVFRIGMLERTSMAINAANVNDLRQGLRELGYVEGKNYVIEYRSADGRDDQFPGLATDLVRLKVDLILTRGTPATLAAQNATATIPVIITGVSDPVAQGIVATLGRPGANVSANMDETVPAGRPHPPACPVEVWINRPEIPVSLQTSSWTPPARLLTRTPSPSLSSTVTLWEARIG
jgi:hypothetical protein